MLLSYLKLFSEVAKYGNITKAAQETHITQPALSKAIAKLEDNLGYRLFDRHVNGVALNKVGEIVLDTYRKIMLNISEMQDSLDDYAGGKSGEVRIATTFPSFRIGWLNECLKTYRETHPNVLFNQIMLGYDKVLSALKNNEIDFVLTDSALIDSDIIWHELYRERQAFLMAKNSPLARQPLIKLSDVRNESFVSYVNHYPCSPETDRISSICKLAGFTPKVVFRGDLEDAVLNEVAAGRGILLMLERSCIKLTQDPQSPWYNKLAYCALEEDFSYRIYGIASLKERTMNIAISDLQEIFKNADFSI